MDQWIASLPKPLVAIGVISLVFLFLIISDPPKTVCDTQIEIFREAQKGFLYPGKEVNGMRRPSEARRFYERCKAENSPGACFQLFEGFKKFAIDLSNVPQQCSSTIGSEPVVQEWLWNGLHLMSQIAWGSRAPASYLQKNGWFDASELVVYCRLKKNAVTIYGSEPFAEWQAQVLAGLPQAEKLTPEVRLQNSLFSTSCAAYR